MATPDESNKRAHIVMKNVRGAVVSGNTYAGDNLLNAEDVDDLSVTDNRNIFPPTIDARPARRWYSIAAWQMWLIVAAIFATVVGAYIVKFMGWDK